MIPPEHRAVLDLARDVFGDGFMPIVKPRALPFAVEIASGLGTDDRRVNLDPGRSIP